MEDLIQETARFLDTDPEFLCLTDGMVEWADTEVHFRKTDSEIFLFVDGVLYTTNREGHDSH